MEDELLTSQLYPPGSDIAIGFRPGQVIWGRTGNDVLLGYQPTEANLDRTRIDFLLGDLAIEDPAFREWKDTFVLGDWTRPYYADGSALNFGLNDLALIPDFNPRLDTIQLYGTAKDYQLFNTAVGTAILFVQDTSIDLVSFLLGAENLDLSASYFQFRGNTPPVVSVDASVVSSIKQFGTTEYDIPLSISVDPTGNVYIAGGTNGSLVQANAGLRDNFVVKYDDQGNILLSEQFGTAGFDTIYGIDTDGAGNFYVTGTTDGELGGPRQAETLDTFVAKYDSQGNQIWLQQIGQNDIFNAFNIAVDEKTGDVFISGADVKATLEDDTFIIKFDTDGNQQWFVETGIPGFLNFDESYGLTVSDNGSVYATGWTSSDLSGENAGLYDNWLAKYDNNTGETLWVAQYGTADYEWSWDVRTDSAENIYTAGWTLGDLGGTNAGSYDVYLSKFDPQGNSLWVKQFGTAEDDEAYSLYIDKSDNIFISGYTDGNLGGTNAGSYDAWVAKYDQSGNQIWITQFGTSDRDELYGIVADEKGNLYATGITQGSLGSPNAGSFDGWIASLETTSGKLLDFSASPEVGTPPQVPQVMASNEALTACLVNTGVAIESNERYSSDVTGQDSQASILDDDLLTGNFENGLDSQNADWFGAQGFERSIVAASEGTDMFADAKSGIDSVRSASDFNGGGLSESSSAFFPNSEVLTTAQNTLAEHLNALNSLAIA